jgi:hypothetical protein
MTLSFWDTSLRAHHISEDFHASQSKTPKPRRDGDTWHSSRAETWHPSGDDTWNSFQAHLGLSFVIFRVTRVTLLSMKCQRSYIRSPCQIRKIILQGISKHNTHKLLNPEVSEARGIHPPRTHGNYTSGNLALIH